METKAKFLEEITSINKNYDTEPVSYTHLTLPTKA